MILDVRLEGFDEPVGHLTRSDDGGTEFLYSPRYVARDDAVPLSLSLPLKGDPYPDFAARPYFQNLLQENDQLSAVIDRERLSRDDVAGLLYHLGGDCAGAVSCLPAGAPAIKIPGFLATDYDYLTTDEVAAIARSLAESGAPPDGTRDPSPIAGVQPKFPLVVAPDGRFALPKPGTGAPTTHILKIPRRRDAREAELEAAAARLAAACGLDAVIPERVDFDGVAGLLIRRFDRTMSFDGLIRRIHQEDFAQALSLPPSLKYERNGGTNRAFDFPAILSVLSRCAAPATALQSFLLATFFNLAIGNSDNHAKNHALLYDQGRAPRLAPLYDLLPIRISSRYRHDFAFRIGAAKIADDLTSKDAALFLKQAGMTNAGALRFANKSVATLLRKLDAAIDVELTGLKDFADLIGMESRRIAELLGLDVKLTDRDYFAPRAPGWATS